LYPWLDLDNPSSPFGDELSRTLALMELDKWYPRLRSEMEDRFKSLCQHLNKNDRRACEQEGIALTNKIIDDVGMAIKVIIDKFNRWPEGGNFGKH